MFKCYSDWQIALNGHYQIDIIYLDYSKAFDSVIHCKLLAKLQCYGVDGMLLNWIRNFLPNVNSCSCSLYVVVRPSVCLSSVTFVHPTQAIEIFSNISMPFGNLAICDPSVKIFRRSSQRNPSVGGFNQRGVEKCSDF